jgi:hypothetical protein
LQEPLLLAVQSITESCCILPQVVLPAFQRQAASALFLMPCQTQQRPAAAVVVELVSAAAALAAVLLPDAVQQEGVDLQKQTLVCFKQALGSATANILLGLAQHVTLADSTNYSPQEARTHVLHTKMRAG